MRIQLKLTIVALLAVVGLSTMALVPASAASCDTPAECAQSGVDKTGGTGNSASIGDIIKTVVSVLLFILGAVSVIMIVIGGIRYSISQGETAAITSAKNTILYAVVGLVVALLAYAIVNFVITQFVATTTPKVLTSEAQSAITNSKEISHRQERTQVRYEI